MLIFAREDEAHRAGRQRDEDGFLHQPRRPDCGFNAKARSRQGLARQAATKVL